MTPKFHKPGEASWTNASGDHVPVKHITVSEKLREQTAAKLFKKALSIETALLELYADLNEANAAITNAVRKEYEIKNGQAKKATKGGFTWYSFNGDVKFETNVNDFVKWDEDLMKQAHDLLNEYLSSQLTDDQELIKGIVNEAFANSKGAIDSRQVFRLLKYESKINSKRFTRACELMRNAQRVDKSKAYFKISVRQEDGSYQALNLNLSNL